VCFGVLLFNRHCSHIICIYIYSDFVKSPAHMSSILFHDGEGTMHLIGSRRNNIRETLS
jgi:hypothetical protein